MIYQLPYKIHRRNCLHQAICKLQKKNSFSYFAVLNKMKSLTLVDFRHARSIVFEMGVGAHRTILTSQIRPFFFFFFKRDII